MATPYATYRYGDQSPIQYTPGSAVSAGDVIDMGTGVGVAVAPIAANVEGSICTTGVFDFVKKSGDTPAVFGLLYWDATNHYATTTGAADATIGRAVKAAASGDATVRVNLIPS